MRLGIAGIALGLVLGGLGCGDPLPAVDPPNIVLIISDDQGWGDFGFMGSPVVKTPNIDRLAAEGVVFPMAHATSSVCKPTLTTLLTGLYPYQWNLILERRGAPMWARPGEQDVMNLSRRLAAERELVNGLATLPRRLRGAGYMSFEGGKFSHGSWADSGFDRGMTSEDESRFSLAGGKGTILGRNTMRPLFRFMRESRGERFFAWFAPKLPHIPFDAPEKHVALYADLGLSDDAVGYYANCSWLDERVGHVLERLERNGQRENTLVVLIADNGWQVPDPDEPTGNLGGRKGKGSLYDLGFRTPIVFHWPGHIEGGRSVDVLASAADIVPTLVDYAGAGPADDLPGVSLRPWIEGTPPDAEPRTQIVGSTTFDRGESGERVEEEAYYVRTREWHYVRLTRRGASLLFDMTRDPEQDHDVAPEHPDLVARFDADIAAWRREMERGLPSLE